MSGILSSCFENGYLEEIPEVNLSDDFTIRRIVHTDISMSTGFNDSLVTSRKSSFLLGTYPDENRGNIKATPYFEFTVSSSSFRFEETDELDSLVLILKFEKTHYDTLSSFNLNVWEITETFDYRNDDKVMYHFENFNTGRTPLVTQRVQINPSVDSISITLPRGFGINLFEKGKGLTSIFASDADFKDVFKGFKLEVEGNSPLIHIATDSHISFYFQQQKETIRSNEVFSIPVGSTSRGYTQLRTDLSNTVFGNVTVGTLLPAVQTNGMTLIDELGMAGTKVTFDGLTALAEQSNDYYIAEAHLFLPVKRNTYSSNFNPPATKLDVYLRTEAGQYQRYLSQISLSSLDYIYQEATYFRIPVTAFVDSQIRGQNPDTGLWMEITPDTDLSVPYVILGQNSTLHKTRLEITLIPLK